MMIEEHDFTKVINRILIEEFGDKAEAIFRNSELLIYLNIKTVSASRDSKARSSFGSIYAIFVLVEDYVERGFNISGDYGDAVGANFSDLLARQRELPFGSKLQNHALNHRLNQEFRKYFPVLNQQPILRNVETHEYWFNENLLTVNIDDATYNIAQAIIRIVIAYIDAKQESLTAFIDDCHTMQAISQSKPEEVIDFIMSLLRPAVDARIFEIVSFAILKTFYNEKSIFWGWEIDAIKEDKLVLFKTGRTNANDGGIDYVMRPLGRFFQVTETLDLRKYFLDIDKVQKYPLTFVVKTNIAIDELLIMIEENARKQYPIRSIVRKYMECIEEVINIPGLSEKLFEVAELGKINFVIDEIVKHSQVEFDLL